MPELKVLLTLQDRMSKELDNAVKNLEKFKTQLRAVGVAMTGLGVAGIKLTDDARHLNAEFAMTAVTLGVGTGEVRDMAIAISDVSFSLQEAANTMDLLARAGLRGTDEIKQTAKDFATLGDAVGMQADQVANELIPAFKMFGIALTDVSRYGDKLTWLTRNTTMGLGDFAGAMQWVAREGKSLNVTVDDMIAVMAVLEDRGLTGTKAILAFRTAVSQAVDKNISLTAALKITDDELNTYKSQMSTSAGLMDKAAKAAQSQYGILDKLHAEWAKLTLRLGIIIRPLEAVFGIMTALGPVLLFLSTKIGLTTVAFVANTAVMIASRTATIALTAAKWALVAAEEALNLVWAATPVGFVVGAIAAIGGAIYGLTKLFHSGSSDTKRYVSDLQKGFTDIKGTGVTAIEDIAKQFDPLIAKAKEAGNAEDEVRLAFQQASATIRAHQQTIANMNIYYVELVRLKGDASKEAKDMKTAIDAETVSLKTAIASVDGLVESYTDLLGVTQSDLKGWKDMVTAYGKAIEDANKEVADSEKALTKTYDDALSSRIDALTGWTDLWSGIKKEETTSGGELLSNLLDEARKLGPAAFLQLQGRIRDMLATIPEAGTMTGRELLANLQDELKRFGPGALPEVGKLISDAMAKVPESVSVTGADLLSNLREQVDYFDTWQTNIAALVSKGSGDTFEAFISEIRKMGPESLPQLKALNTMTAGQLSEYITLWQEKSADARSEATAELAPLWTDIQAQIKVIKDGLPAKLAEIGTIFGTEFATFGVGIPDVLGIMTADMIAGKVPFDEICTAIGNTITTNLTDTANAAISSMTIANSMAGIVKGGGWIAPKGMEAGEAAKWARIGAAPAKLPTGKAWHYIGVLPALDVMNRQISTGKTLTDAERNLYTTGFAYYQHGGIIPEPTLLTSLRTMRPYGIAGEAGTEAIMPLRGAGASTQQVYQITIQAGAFLGSRADAEKFGDWIMQAVRKKQRLALGEATF